MIYRASHHVTWIFFFRILFPYLKKKIDKVFTSRYEQCPNCMQLMNYDGDSTLATDPKYHNKYVNHTYCGIQDQQLQGNPCHKSLTTYRLDITFTVMQHTPSTFYLPLFKYVKIIIMKIISVFPNHPMTSLDINLVTSDTSRIYIK